MYIESLNTPRRIFRNPRLTGLLFAALSAGLSSSWAQVPGAFRPNAGTILNIYAPPVEAPTLPAATLPTPVEELPADDAAGVRVKLTRVVLDGVTLLPQAEVEAQLAGLVGQEVSLADLRQAAARITQLYRDQGYFLARAYVPAQEISGGVVRIAVIEGRYDGVTATGSARLDGERVRQLLDAQGVTAGQPVERARLERSLILLEQWADAPAQALLRPGATIGTSHMEIATPPGPLFSGSLGADNYGAYYSGQGRVTPRWPSTVRSASAIRAASGSRTRRAPTPSSPAYQVPVGYDGLTLGASASYYTYALCCEFAALDRTGRRHRRRAAGTLSVAAVASTR